MTAAYLAPGGEAEVLPAVPLSAYSTSPYEMTLNGRSFTGPELARTVKDAMLKQGREFVDGIEKALR